MPLPIHPHGPEQRNRFSLSSWRAAVVIYSPRTNPWVHKRRSGFRDQERAYEQLGFKVLGISKDGRSQARKIHRKYTCRYPCSVTPALPGGQRLMGAYGLKKFMGRGNTIADG